MTDFSFCFFQDPDFFKQYHHFRDKEHENVSQFKLCYYLPVGQKGKLSLFVMSNELILLEGYMGKFLFFKPVFSKFDSYFAYGSYAIIQNFISVPLKLCLLGQKSAGTWSVNTRKATKPH